MENDSLRSKLSLEVLQHRMVYSNVRDDTNFISNNSIKQTKRKHKWWLTLAVELLDTPHCILGSSRVVID